MVASLVGVLTQLVGYGQVPSHAAPSASGLILRHALSA